MTLPTVSLVRYFSQNNMELPTLKIEAEDIKTKVIDVLSPLYIDENTCKRLVAVFEDEIEKGT